MQRAMRHDYNWRSPIFGSTRSQQSIVERTQVLLRAFRESRQMISNLGRSVTQRVDLKTTALDLGHNLRFTSQISHDFNALIGNDKRDQLIVDRRVLNQRAIGAECSLKLSDRKDLLPDCVL